MYTDKEYNELLSSYFYAKSEDEFLEAEERLKDYREEQSNNLNEFNERAI